ncbi:MFS transporter [Streptomyces formicae]|uniref:Putative efflux transporter protein n=1 Tax=Streptomyces formicae TaxID=1616117 RepID=A0A291Q1W5_9ACTN|nr:MFS transporter [Streptomyces formicae]ATL25498.1 putative efflux transporter protein [Streptomyces formicae]
MSRTSGSTTPSPIPAPAPSRRPMTGLLASFTVSLFGTRLSMIALPWLVLDTSDSPIRTGLIVFCEAVPLVVGKALSGPLIDRMGGRSFSVAADLISAVVVMLVPLCYWLDVLPFGVLMVLAAAIGLARGPGDVAKRTLIPTVAEDAGITLERASGMMGTVERIAGAAGPAAAGALVALLSPLWAMVGNSFCFVLSAGLISIGALRSARETSTVVTRDRQTQREQTRGEHPEDRSPEGIPAEDQAPEERHPEESYVERLKAGARFLARNRLLRSIAIMLSVTNLIDAAYGSLLIPVWAKETGGGPAAIGALGSAFGIAAVAGSLLATAFSHKLRRRRTYVIAFLVGGPPRFIVMALDVPLWVVVVTAVADGLAIGFINPIINAVQMERIPRHLLGRVSALTDSVGTAGIPLGPILAGVAVSFTGLAPVLLGCGAIYLFCTVIPPLFPHWRELDSRPRQPEEPEPRKETV